MNEVVKLNFPIELQLGQRLCWAAVACAIAKFYDKEIECQQIDIAKNIFGVKHDQFYSPKKALLIFDNLSSELNRSLTRSEIIDELMNGQPIVACMKHFVGWHLVVIYGFSKGELLIADPLLGEVKCNMSAFTDSYEMYYSWTHSYKTKPATD